ncbi:uncharacterized protein LOC129593460 [Paramacrobiotus metropolitanus]|uniref:uncharacterized protein LOC129593460 n=1 Tax=Paramacrobiotus metropolitanus TaxID=2943436 RepID=UPI0024456C4D|nr:uncharacterized protein LOC129593460 [Paramacrobiotus metropolitanus]
MLFLLNTILFLACYANAEVAAAQSASSYRQARAVSLSLAGTIGFSPRDILLESLESKTCFDMKNAGKRVGTEVVLNSCGFPVPSWNQLFTLQDVDGQHFVINNRNHKCLTFSSSQALASADQCTGDSAKFYLDMSADGQSYLLRQKGSNRCVTTTDRFGTNGGDEGLKAAACDRNDPRQFWRIFSKDKPRRFAPHPSRCSN